MQMNSLRENTLEKNNLNKNKLEKNSSAKNNLENKMLLIGLTGNMGSGKSAVGTLLEEEGFYRIDTDQISRAVMEIGQHAYDEIIGYFGTQIVNPDRSINRKKLAGIVFNDPKKLSVLTKISHYHIKEQMWATVDEVRHYYKKIVIEAPLLIEAGIHNYCDRVWVVYADEEIRLRRIFERDGISREEALQRTRYQLPYEELKQYATHVIENNGNRSDLYQQVRRILNASI